MTPDWRTLGGYFARLEKQGIGINLASYVGATQVRRMVLGDGDRQPTADELERMKALVRDAMREGAVGVSTALQYPPAPYAQTEELIALAAEAGALGGGYATHMRSEGDEIDAAIDEAIRIGREAQHPGRDLAPQGGGQANWGRMREVVAKIDSARKAGVDIAADTYAYPRGSTRCRRSFRRGRTTAAPPSWSSGSRTPPRAAGSAATCSIPRALGQRVAGDPGPSSVLIASVQNPALEPYLGKTLAQVAAERRTDPIDALFDVLVEDRAYTRVAVFGMSEPDIALALKQPWVSIDNDSQGTSPDGLLGKEHPHPRAYGTFPRILRKYVRGRHRSSRSRTRSASSARFPRSACASATAACSRRACGRTSWCSIRHSVRDRATFAEPEPALGGNAVGAGERHSGDRRRPGDRRVAGAGAAWSGVAAVTHGRTARQSY